MKRNNQASLGMSVFGQRNPIIVYLGRERLPKAHETCSACCRVDSPMPLNRGSTSGHVVSIDCQMLMGHTFFCFLLNFTSVS